MNKLVCIIETEGNEHLVLSPTVGHYSPFYHTGSNLGENDTIGSLKLLNTRYNLVLPAGISGAISQCLSSAYILPVEYGQELLRIAPFSAQTKKRPSPESNGIDIHVPRTDEGFLITAFTTGIFYQRPTPDSPPFVSLGQEVEKGKNLGLIEVMKTFNHIIFQGTGKSTKGRIKKIYVQDAQEVKSGQPLFLIE